MTLKLPERRSGQRVNTTLPVILENATGVTRDVSASGVFFWASGTYAVGESMSYSIEPETVGGKMLWKCQGDVVRTEPHDKRTGVAVRITEPVAAPR